MALRLMAPGQQQHLTCSLRFPQTSRSQQRVVSPHAQSSHLQQSRALPLPRLAPSALLRSGCSLQAFTPHRLQRGARTALVVHASTAAVPPDGQQDRGFLQKVQKSIRDFGFGQRSFVEGGVGLFVFTGIGVSLMLISWARGGSLFSRGRGYNCILEFPSACGITVGTPLRIRGVRVGSTMRVEPSLERVDVLVEVTEPTTVIPRNALIEANQSGLIAEPLIDITPQTPIPDWKALPTDDNCEEEGNIVCNGGRIKGQPGVAMDDLVYVCTKIARQMDAAGIDKVLEAVDVVTQVVEDARPLLLRAIELADQVTPLLGELRQGDLVGNIEALTRSAAQAAADITRLQGEVLTEDNVEALRGSVKTLTKTLEHVEAISGDVGGLTADSRVKANLKQLIEALSRLTVD